MIISIDKNNQAKCEYQKGEWLKILIQPCIFNKLPVEQRNVVMLALRWYIRVKTHTFNDVNYWEYWRWPFSCIVQAFYFTRHKSKLIWFWPARKLRKAGWIVIDEGKLPSWFWFKYIKWHQQTKN